jgi:hypothetical protein
MAPVPEAVVTTLTAIMSTIRSVAIAHVHESINTLSKSAIHKRDEGDTTDPNSSNFIPGQGVVEPTHVPTKALFALFGILGAVFVVVGIWFFMVTPNGGFVFKEGDWDDYVTTVMRRKGPNGTTLSGATKSTQLGGGSVLGWGRDKWGKTEYSGYSETSTERSDDMTEVTESLVGTESVVTSITRGVSGRYQRDKLTEKKSRSASKGGKTSKRLRPKDKDAREKSRLRHELIPDEEASIGFPESVTYDDEAGSALHSYKHEKSAKVGGLNRPADSSAFGSSYNGSATEGSESLLAGRQETPENSPKKEKRRSRVNEYTPDSSPTKTAGIRKVETVYQQDRERKLRREKNRSAGGPSSGGSGSGAPKRNFSYTPGDDGLSSVVGSDLSAISERTYESSHVSSQAGLLDPDREARRAERERRRREREWERERERGAASDVTAQTESSGTKSYYHPIAGLSPVAKKAGEAVDEFEEKRRRRREREGGYRRER